MTTWKNTYSTMWLTGTLMTFSMAASAAPETARKADAFVDTIGVNVKLGYIDTQYNEFNTVKAKLQELGIRHVRDGVPVPNTNNSTMISRINDLSNNGIKMTAIFTPQNDGLDAQASIIARLNAVPGAVVMAEGPNEPDHGFSFNGKTSWVPAVIDYQNVLWAAIKNNSTYSSLPVIAPSISFPPNSSQVRGMEHVANYGNTHSYHGARNPETTEVNLDFDNFYIGNALVETAGRPIIATETGNPTTPVDDPSLWMPRITKTSQGKYAMRTFLFYFNKGIVRTFPHELIDSRSGGEQSPGNSSIGPNKDEGNFGMFNWDWTPKPAATGIKNIISLLKEATLNTTTKKWDMPTFTAGSLNYSLSGSTANVHRTLLQKSNGRFYLVLWQAAKSYDYDTFQDISVPNVSVTINLITPIGSANSYLPYNNTTPTSLTVSNNQISVSVPDHPIIVELIPLTNNSSPNLVSNPGFDAEAYNTQTPSGWSESGTSDASFTETNGSGHTNARHGTHWYGSAYNVFTYQSKTGLTNGLYTLSAKAKRGGSQSPCVLEANGFGGTVRTAPIPTGTTTGAYSTVEIKDINVTNGTATIGIRTASSGGSGNGSWVYFDDVEFVKQ